MSSRFFAFAGAAIVAVAAAATSGCLGNGITNNPPPSDSVCNKGALKVGDSLSYIFDAASGCRTVDLYSAETTYANSFSLALTSGTGYLITMASTADSDAYLRPALELVDSAKKLLAYDTFYWPQQAALTFVADSTVNYSVRAATEDTLSGDFGAYFIKMQQCRVPAPRLVLPTDAAVVTDTLTKSDCLMPESDFNISDSSRVQLYSFHLDKGQARTLTYSSPQPLVILIGPTYDTFASLAGSLGADSVDSQSGSLEFAPDSAANYTIVIGTYNYSANVPYSLSISAEHAPTMQRMRLRRIDPSSKNQFRPRVALRQSTLPFKIRGAPK